MCKTISLIFAAISSAFLFQACEIDHGLGLSPSKVIGHVVFFGPEFRPDNVEEVRVVAAAQFPPTGVADIFFSNAVNFGVDTADYEIILPYGEYPALAVLWKPRGKDWALESLLGFYGFRPPFEASLQGVILSEAEPVASNIDIPALWNFAQFDARVEGELTYAGTWPANTDIVVLGGFNEIPDLQNLLPALGFIGGINFTLPKNVPSYHYEMAVRNGTYKFIGLFWKDQSSGWDELRCIGFYPTPNDPAQPGSFTLPPEGRITGIDFVADFNTLPDGVKIGGGR